ncbi:MAG: hypothetical protein K2H85_10825, partial [Allobaculum sp.]|nr:hypothetical protein [Allobaculum sp.]
IKEFWNKYEILLRKNVHGCICVIIDSKIKIADEFSKGIWLDNPIKLVEGVVTYKQSLDYHDLMKLEYNTELTLKCINNDGITVFDEKGNLIAYNVFVKSKESAKHAGGARRRAAEWLCEVKPEGCLAVYFQSQDGEAFFKEI